MDPELEHTTYFLRKWGFDTELITPPDKAHFGNWVLLATRTPLALHVINDRGLVLDTFSSLACSAKNLLFNSLAVH